MTAGRPFAGAQVVNVQGWPEAEAAKARPARENRFPRLATRAGIVFVAAAERGAFDPDGRPEERFGLGAFVEFLGPSVLSAGLVVADGNRSRALRAWAAERSAATVAGQRPWQVVTVSEFFDYREGLFTRRAYTGAGWCIGADLGRTFGLVALPPAPGRSWHPCHRRDWSGGVAFRLPTWPGHDNRPALRVAPSGARGWRVAFAMAPRGEGWGKWEGGRPFAGRFVDVTSAAAALDAIDSAELGDHLEAFGLAPLDCPAAVSLDRRGAETMAQVAEAVYELARRLDDEASGWLTTRDDRLMGRARLDLCALQTPAALASGMLARGGLVPPAEKFDVPHELLDRFMSAHHGGWLSAELVGAGLFPAVDIDIHSAYPAMASLLGWWPLICAESVRTEDACADVLGVCEQVARGDLSALFERGTWERLGFTVCEVRPGGEPWPIESPDADNPQGHSAMRSVSGGASLAWTWPDVVLAALRCGRVPEVVSATRVVPVGRQSGLAKHWPAFGGAELSADEDSAVSLVRLRDRLKAQGDTRRAALLRVVVNSLTYGNAVRRDLQGSGRSMSERPGPWGFPPLGASVPAACRLALGMAERLVELAGGTVGYRDTDGLMLVCTPEGGTAGLADGRSVPALSWGALAGVLEAFEPLAVYGPGTFWKVLRDHDGYPLHALVLGTKRYALVTLDANGELAVVVEATEHALGGSVVAPPGMPGRDVDGRWGWTRAVAATAVRRALAEAQGRRFAVDAWPWDRPAAVGQFPALRREQVGSLRQLSDLVKQGVLVRPFGRFISATPSLSAERSAVALDPGGDLAGWAALAWRDGNGRPVRIGTAWEPGTLTVESLGMRAWRWCAAKSYAQVRPVVTAPELVRRVGKSGVVLEVGATSPDADTTGLRAVYAEGDQLRYVHRVARELGPHALARMVESAGGSLPMVTAKRAALGRPLRPKTVAGILHALRPGAAQAPQHCQLEGCGADIWRLGAKFCCRKHQDLAKKRRKRARSKTESEAPIERNTECLKR